MPIGAAIAIGSAIYGGGKALGLWGKPPEQKYTQTPEERAYWDTMQKRSTQGMGAGAMFGIVNRGSAAASNAYNNMQIANQGRHLQAGTQGVASREQDKIGQQQLLRATAEISAGAEEKNELFKIASQDQLGQMGMDRSKLLSEQAYINAMAKYSSRQESIGQMFEGLTAAAPGLDKMFGMATTPAAKTAMGKIMEKISTGAEFDFDDIGKLREYSKGLSIEDLAALAMDLDKAGYNADGSKKE